jgi:hypothetical protein
MRELMVPKVSTTPLFRVNRLCGGEQGVSRRLFPARHVTFGDESSVYRQGDRPPSRILGLRSTNELSTPECENLMVAIANRAQKDFHDNANQRMLTSGQRSTIDVPRPGVAPARHVRAGIQHANVLPRSSCVRATPQ